MKCEAWIVKMTIVPYGPLYAEQLQVSQTLQTPSLPLVVTAYHHTDNKR